MVERVRDCGMRDWTQRVILIDVPGQGGDVGQEPHGRLSLNPSGMASKPGAMESPVPRRVPGCRGLRAAAREAGLAINTAAAAK